MAKGSVLTLFFCAASVLALVFLVAVGADFGAAVEYLSQDLPLTALGYIDFGSWFAWFVCALVLMSASWFIGGAARGRKGLVRLWSFVAVLIWIGVCYFLFSYEPGGENFSAAAIGFWAALAVLCLLVFVAASLEGAADAVERAASGLFAATATIGIVFLIPPAVGGALKLRLKADVAKRMANAPNVLLISIDTLRADHLGCYGYPKDLTPNLDELAKESVVFLNAIAPSPWTLPSHAAMLTGFLPSAIGVYTEDNKVPDGVTTLAEILKENGYFTMSANGGGYLERIYGFAQGFDIYGRMMRNLSTEIELINKKAMQYMSRAQDRRFFFFYHTYQVHAPYYFHEGFSEPEARLCRSGCICKNGECFCKAPPAPECHIAYEGEIRYMDHHIGELLKFLKKQGLYDNTMIIFTSDHGEDFVQDARGITQHGFLLYDELIKVPLIIKFPRGEMGGTVVSAQVRLVDIVPTVLDYLGIDAGNLQGKSLMPLIRGEESGVRAAVAEYYKRPLALTYYPHLNNDKVAVRLPGAKLIVNVELGTIELYRLDDDPLERKNLFANPSREALELMADMLATLLNELQRIPKHPEEETKAPPMPEHLKEQLKALGYIQ